MLLLSVIYSEVSVNEVFRVKVNEEGRLVIPAAARKQLGITPGQELLVQIQGQELRVYTTESAIKRLQDWCAAKIPAGVSLVEELIQERRAEAARELND